MLLEISGTFFGGSVKSRFFQSVDIGFFLAINRQALFLFMPRWFHSSITVLSGISCFEKSLKEPDGILYIILFALEISFEQKQFRFEIAFSTNLVKILSDASWIYKGNNRREPWELSILLIERHLIKIRPVILSYICTILEDEHISELIANNIFSLFSSPNEQPEMNKLD